MPRHGWVNTGTAGGSGYKRSSFAQVSTALPPDKIGNRNLEGHAQSIRWVLYGDETFREAKRNNAQRAIGASS